MKVGVGVRVVRRVSVVGAGTPTTPDGTLTIGGAWGTITDWTHDGPQVAAAPVGAPIAQDGCHDREQRIDT
ncbi:hypothetical protein [Kitasatospora indigofera]|uniref:hypothetical protein n=1 Tax=Kitasatospora indigofera TaxID=67307 RepID=UPI0032490999